MRSALIGASGIAALAIATGVAAQAGGGSAQADLRKTEGQVVARATVEQAGEAVRLRIEASGLPAGTYGAHIHTAGLCDAPDFASAGGHWNPMSRQHGRENPQGAHMGDLPNLTVAGNGTGSLTFDIPSAQLRGGHHPLLDADGAAVIIHASPDDYRTDPTGNSGARVACGVLN
ncbi:superoxide dismutase family protein [Sphingosinicella sp. LHD-64]|uniref:superoxide dismutase family protein n=1 Tax=Sphingosinicella sp. LHD-64 TaxID=3072139 RepID=UPI00280C8A78|nr:superoxide dismutase family protein [Sphingosinicella sp. LHD-64]MDQ8757859.1 superoxide dismutase family protein [Sphingosinicella sp. LHD-64]